MKHFIQILVLCIGIPMGAGAQTFTQRLQKQPAAGHGSVTIHQSDSIDKLVNSAILTTKSSSTTATTSPTTPKPATPSTSSKTSTTTPSSPTSTTNTTVIPDTVPKMIRNGHKITGYRVQAFAGGNSRKDRQQAEQTRNAIKSHYPNVPVYVHFYSPRWICRVGNYRTYEEAHQMLVSLRDLGFDQATIVKGKITVAY
jgi:cell division protein FtsN